MAVQPLAKARSRSHAPTPAVADTNLLMTIADEVDAQLTQSTASCMKTVG